MNISSVSFGKKIPIATCKIFDIKENGFVEATFCEYDCKDTSDYQEVKDLSGEWFYRGTIAHGLKIKTDNLKRNVQDEYSYYCLQVNNDEVLGLCCCKNDETENNIQYITRKYSSRYKRVGQAMVAVLAKMALQAGKLRLYVSNAINEADDFYEKRCGFKREKKYDFKMNRITLQELVEKNEDVTLV